LGSTASQCITTTRARGWLPVRLPARASRAPGDRWAAERQGKETDMAVIEGQALLRELREAAALEQRSVSARAG
jgi:hypothetical protein